MKQVSVSQARAELASLVKPGERTVITRNGQPIAVLLDVDDFRVLRAMQDLVADQEAMARVQRVHEQVQKGDLSGLVEMDFSAEEEALADSPAQGPAGRFPSGRVLGIDQERVPDPANLLAEAPGAPLTRSQLASLAEQLAALAVSVARALEEQSRTTLEIRRVLEQQSSHSTLFEHMQAALKEETLEVAKNAAAAAVKQAAISR